MTRARLAVVRTRKPAASIVAASARAGRSARTICVHPREFDQPTDLVGAVAVIALDNQPSGDQTPSAEDRALTRRLVDAGKLLGIALLDHIVSTSDGALHSLRDGLAHVFAG